MLCSICGKSVVRLGNHMKNVHDKPSCPLCGREFSDLRFHVCSTMRARELGKYVKPQNAFKIRFEQTTSEKTISKQIKVFKTMGTEEANALFGIAEQVNEYNNNKWNLFKINMPYMLESFRQFLHCCAYKNIREEYIQDLNHQMYLAVTRDNFAAYYEMAEELNGFEQEELRNISAKIWNLKDDFDLFCNAYWDETLYMSNEKVIADKFGFDLTEDDDYKTDPIGTVNKLVDDEDECIRQKLLDIYGFKKRDDLKYCLTHRLYDGAEKNDKITMIPEDLKTFFLDVMRPLKYRYMINKCYEILCKLFGLKNLVNTKYNLKEYKTSYCISCYKGFETPRKTLMHIFMPCKSIEVQIAEDILLDPSAVYTMMYNIFEIYNPATLDKTGFYDVAQWIIKHGLTSKNSDELMYQFFIRKREKKIETSEEISQKKFRQGLLDMMKDIIERADEICKGKKDDEIELEEPEEPEEKIDPNDYNALFWKLVREEKAHVENMNDIQEAFKKGWDYGLKYVNDNSETLYKRVTKTGDVCNERLRGLTGVHITGCDDTTVGNRVDLANYVGKTTTSPQQVITWSSKHKGTDAYRKYIDFYWEMTPEEIEIWKGVEERQGIYFYEVRMDRKQAKLDILERYGDIIPKRVEYNMDTYNKMQELVHATIERFNYYDDRDMSKATPEMMDNFRNLYATLRIFERDLKIDELAKMKAQSIIDGKIFYIQDFGACDIAITKQMKRYFRLHDVQWHNMCVEEIKKYFENALDFNDKKYPGYMAERDIIQLTDMFIEKKGQLYNKRFLAHFQDKYDITVNDIPDEIKKTNHDIYNLKNEIVRAERNNRIYNAGGRGNTKYINVELVRQKLYTAQHRLNNLWKYKNEFQKEMDIICADEEKQLDRLYKRKAQEIEAAKDRELAPKKEEMRIEGIKPEEPPEKIMPVEVRNKPRPKTKYDTYRYQKRYRDWVDYETSYLRKVAENKNTKEDDTEFMYEKGKWQTFKDIFEFDTTCDKKLEIHHEPKPEKIEIEEPPKEYVMTEKDRIRINNEMYDDFQNNLKTDIKVYIPKLIKDIKHKLQNPVVCYTRYDYCEARDNLYELESDRLYYLWEIKYVKKKQYEEAPELRRTLEQLKPLKIQVFYMGPEVIEKLEFEENVKEIKEKYKDADIETQKQIMDVIEDEKKALYSSKPISKPFFIEKNAIYERHPENWPVPPQKKIVDPRRLERIDEGYETIKKTNQQQKQKHVDSSCDRYKDLLQKGKEMLRENGLSIKQNISNLHKWIRSEIIKQDITADEIIDAAEKEDEKRENEPIKKDEIVIKELENEIRTRQKYKYDSAKAAEVLKKANDAK